MDFQVTFDCVHPPALANFWAAALGYRPADPPEGSATWEEWLEKMGIPEEEWEDGARIVDPGKRGPRIYLQAVPEPKGVKNRLHLDLNASDGPAAPLEQRKERSMPKPADSSRSAHDNSPPTRLWTTISGDAGPGRQR